METLFSTSGHESILMAQDPTCGLKAIIAIHDTTLGPALGGCRFWNYKNDQEAIFDVTRLSRGMTYKAALAGLSLGGGKSVIIGDPKKLKNETLLRTFGRFVESLGGRYITAEDVNINVSDMELVAKETQYVTGITSRKGGSGDPSPFTALGVYSGIKAAVAYKLKKDNLKGLTIAVQGCGAVGTHLIEYLAKDGAKLIIADIDSQKVAHLAKKYGASVVDQSEIHAQKVDVFAPCALGAILNDDTIKALQTSIIAGAANNQLLNEEIHGKALQQKNILYAPDYVINAGGLINVCHELKGYDSHQAVKDAEKIYDTLFKIFKTADDKKIPTFKAANQMAESIIGEEKSKTGYKFLSKNFNNQSWIKMGELAPAA